MSKETKEEKIVLKVLDLEIDYKRDEEAIKKISNINLTNDYLNYAIQKHYKDGLEGQMKRIVGRLLRKIDDALDTKPHKVKLEPAELDIIKKAFDKVSVPSEIVKYWIVLEEIVEKL